MNVVKSGVSMELMAAINKPFKPNEVCQLLISIGFKGMTITEVKSLRPAKVHTETCRGADRAVNFLSKIKIEAAVVSKNTNRAIPTIGVATEPV